MTEEETPWLPGKFRLASVLKERALAEGGYLNLARAVHVAFARRMGWPVTSEVAAGFVVDRRKLNRIAEAPESGDQRLPITLRELAAIDAYLEAFDESLAHRPLFEKPEFLQPLADSGEAVFLLGARRKRFHVDLSHWDVGALRSVLRGVQRLNPRMRFDVENVMRFDTADDAEAFVDRNHRELFHSGPSLVGIGSPRVSHGTGVIFAHMFGLRGAFSALPADCTSPPFRFVWPETEPDEHGTDLPIVPSPFVIEADELRTRYGAEAERLLALPEQERWAVATEDGLHVAQLPTRDEPGHSYAVVAMQRRPAGQVWLAVAGLQGAATFGAAEHLRGMGRTLPQVELGFASKVLYAVIEVRVSRLREDDLLPEVTFQELVGPVREWTPPTETGG